MPTTDDGGTVTSNERMQQLAARIADGQDISAELDAPIIEKFRVLADIAAAYRSVMGKDGPDTATTQTLFQWGHLNVLEKLGEGGFGEVFRAYDGVLDREVALKLRSGDRSSAAESRAFIQEARRLARVRHPNVLAIHGADIHDGRVGLWMDLLDGQDLKQHHIQHGCMDSNAAYSLALDVAAALTAVHSAGLVHGDIKAANIMVHADGEFVLMDFGVGSETVDSDAGPRAGTPLIMAPELFTGSAPGPATDQYSLGVLLFRQLSGAYPLVAETSADLHQAHATGTIRSLSTPCPRLPRGLIKLVDALLCVDPAGRPAAPQVIEQVQWLLDAPKRRSKRIVSAVFVAVLVVGTLASGLGYFAAKKSEAVARASETAAVKSQEKAEEVRCFVLSLFATSNPEQEARGDLVTAAELLVRGAQRIDQELQSQPEIQAEMLAVVGNIYMILGRYNQAETLLQRALTLRLDVLGHQHPDVAHRLGMLGNLLRETGDYTKAEPILREALALNRKLYDDKNPNVAYSFYDLGALLVKSGDYGEAESILLQTRIRFNQSLSKGHADTALPLMGLGRLYLAKQQPEAAERAFRQALKIFQTAFKEGHWHLGETQSLLGASLSAQGQYAAAERFLLDGHAGLELTLGAQHPRTRRAAAFLDAHKRRQRGHIE